MRKIFIILLLSFSAVVGATNYYVATTGNNSNTGAIDQPWATWDKAFSTAVAGDTVFFRGGVYNEHAALLVDNSGTAGNPIVFSNYPGEEPIMDCGWYRPTGLYNQVIYTSSKSYIDFIGLTVRNVLQNGTLADEVGNGIMGFYFYEGTMVRAIRCKAYNISGIGFMSAFNTSDGEHYFTNCDAWNVIDTLSKAGYVGGRGTGFRSNNAWSTLGHTYFNGCRAWNCSDQGFSFALDATKQADSCWSFNNGYGEAGDGHGFKLGWMTKASDSVRAVVRNCIAAYNDYSGMVTNDYGYSNVCKMTIYNNTAYANGTGRFASAYGFWVYNTTGTDAGELTRVFRNNISYGNQTGAILVQSGALYTHSNNSWDITGLTIKSTDFLSLDSTGITGARQADGSLPDIDFLKLSSTSQLIDQGVNVGITYAGDAPDLGAYEWDDYATPPALPSVSTISPYAVTSSSCTTGGYMIDAGGLSITDKGVCWGTSANPTIAGSHTSAGTGTDNYTVSITGLTELTTYHVRAYATNSAGTSYGTDMSFATTQSGIVKHGGSYVRHGGKYIIMR